MGKNIYFVLFLFAFAVTVNSDNSTWDNNWPLYINKCVADSPDLSRCMTDYANYALPYIFPGDAAAGFITVVPFSFDGLSGLDFGGQNGTFNLRITHPKAYGLNHFYVHNMHWNFTNRSFSIEFKYDNAIRLMGNYNSSGTFLNTTFNGAGYTDMIFLNGNVTYKTTYNKLIIDNEEFIQIYNSQCKTEEYLRVLFESPQATVQQGLNLNAYLNNNSQVFHEMIAPEWNKQLCDIIDGTLEPMFFNFPLTTIFN